MTDRSLFAEAEPRDERAEQALESFACTDDPTPRRASDKPPSTQFQRKPRRAAVDQLDHHQELLVALERLAVSLTIDLEPGYARQVRELARRFT